MISMGRIITILRSGKRNSEAKCFCEVQDCDASFNRIDRGVCSVPLKQIVGSVGKCLDFDSQFTPKSHVAVDRLTNIKQAMREGKPIPPIKLYKIKDEYYCFVSRGIFSQDEIRCMRTSSAAVSALGRNRSIKEHRFFPVCLLILLVAMVSACAMPPQVKSLDEILKKEGIHNRVRYGYRCTVGAHRGASEEHRENTIVALKAADKNSKYAFIEFDVQYSKDRRIVVYHDKRLLRLYGSMKVIGNSTFAELSEITHGEIAAYDEVIGILKKKLNIEIKSQGDDQEDQRLVDEIIADIQARKRDNDVLISSISSNVIEYVNRTYPDIPTGQVFWLTSSTYLHLDALTKKLYADVNATRADYLMLHMANLRNLDDLLKFKPRGKTIVFWDFSDTIYIVHKDFSDRLWGDSFIRTFFQFVQYKIASAFQ